jgi:hypothetical protein
MVSERTLAPPDWVAAGFSFLDFSVPNKYGSYALTDTVHPGSLSQEEGVCGTTGFSDANPWLEKRSESNYHYLNTKETEAVISSRLLKHHR